MLLVAALTGRQADEHRRLMHNNRSHADGTDRLISGQELIYGKTATRRALRPSRYPQHPWALVANSSSHKTEKSKPHALTKQRTCKGTPCDSMPQASPCHTGSHHGLRHLHCRTEPGLLAQRRPDTNQSPIPLNLHRLHSGCTAR